MLEADGSDLYEADGGDLCEADSGDLCEADSSDLCEADSSELATACFRLIPQLPPHFSVTFHSAKPSFFLAAS